MTPPNNPQVELALLGCVLLEPVATLRLCSERGVSPEWLYTHEHAELYAALLSMSERQGPERINILTFADFIKQQGAPDTDRLMLDHAVDAAITPTKANEFLDILHDRYLQRKIIETGNLAKGRAQGEDEPVQILADIAAACMKLTESRSRAKTPDQLHAEAIESRQRVKLGGSAGYASFWPEVDSYLGSYIPPDLTVVAAETSTGKTAWAMCEMLHKARAGIPVAYHSNDMRESALRRRAAGVLGGVNVFHFRGPGWTDNEAERFDAAYKDLNSMPLYFNDTRMDINELKAWFTFEALHHGCKFLVVDFLQKIRMNKAGGDRTQAQIVGSWTADIQELGQKFMANTIILSQLRRLGNLSKTETPQHPSLDTLRDSGEIEHNADKVVILSKKPGCPFTDFTYFNPVWDIDCDIAKNREGPTGIVEMSLHIAFQRFMHRVAGDDLRREIRTRLENRT
jgi:replicative DNA helicase